MKKSHILETLIGVERGEKLIHRYLITACMIALPLTANSALVETSWEKVTSPNTSLTLDTSTGLEWLDLSYTDGLSYNTVKNNSAANGMFEGFRLATRLELLSFIGEAGILLSGPSPIDVGEWEKMNTLFGLIDKTDHSIAMARFDEQQFGNTHARWRLFASSNLIGVTSSKYDGDISDEAELFSTASFLVRQQVVPIPSTVWLFGSGLIGLIGLARRKT